MSTPTPQEIAAQLGTGQRGITDFPTTTADEWISVSRLAFAQGRPDLCQVIYKHVARIGDLTYTAAKACMDYFRGTEHIAMAVLVSERFKVIITRDTAGLLSTTDQHVSDVKVDGATSVEGGVEKQEKGIHEVTGKEDASDRQTEVAATTMPKIPSPQEHVAPSQSTIPVVNADSLTTGLNSNGKSSTSSTIISPRIGATTHLGQKGESGPAQSSSAIEPQQPSSSAVHTTQHTSTTQPSSSSAALSKDAESRNAETQLVIPPPGPQEILLAIQRAEQYMRVLTTRNSPTTTNDAPRGPTLSGETVAGSSSTSIGTHGMDVAGASCASGTAADISTRRERRSSTSHGKAAMARRPRISQETGAVQPFQSERISEAGKTDGSASSQRVKVYQASPNGLSHNTTIADASAFGDANGQRTPLRRGEFPRLEVVVPDTGRQDPYPKHEDSNDSEDEDEQDEEEGSEEEQESLEERESAAGDEAYRAGSSAPYASQRCDACKRAKQSCPEQQGKICERHVRATERENRQPCSNCAKGGRVCPHLQGERCYFSHVKQEMSRRAQKGKGLTCERCRIAHRSCPRVYGEICPRSSDASNAPNSSSRQNSARSRRERSRDGEGYGGKAEESPSKRVRFD